MRVLSLIMVMFLVGFVASPASAVLWSDDFSGGLSAEWVESGLNGGTSSAVVDEELVVSGLGAWTLGFLVRDDRGVAIGETLSTDLIGIGRGDGHARARVAAFTDTAATNRVAMGWNKEAGAVVFGELWGAESARGTYPTQPDGLYLTRLSATDWEGGVIYAGVATAYGTCTVTDDTIGSAIGYYTDTEV